MASGNDIAFESVLRAGGSLAITDVSQENHLTYFRINGHQFQTFGDKIYHKDNGCYDSAFVRILAKQMHDPEESARHEQMITEVKSESELWEKHRTAILKIVMMQGIRICVNKGEAAFEEFINRYLFITPEDGVRELIQKLEKRR